MASATYEKVLHEPQQLLPEEQERLADALRPVRHARVLSVRELQTLFKQGLGQPRTLTDVERASLGAWVEEAKRLAASIGAAWQDKNVSAADAVAEQRREL